MSNNANPASFPQFSDLAEPFSTEASTKRLCGAVARRALEISNGFRPLASLSTVLTLEEQKRLSTRKDLIKQHRTHRNIKVDPRVKNGGVHVCIVNTKVLETTAIVRDSIRPRFVTMRWELQRSGWKVTRLELG